MTDGLRAALSILLVASATVGAAWAFTAYNGPLADEPGSAAEEENLFLITYRSAEWEVETETQEFGGDSEITFDPMDVPLQNVTKVEVTLQVATTGPSLNDAYEVSVRDPSGEEVSGSHTVPFPQPEGYIRSDTVITWIRTEQPGAESHRADDRQAAERWSAENRTDPSAKGPWDATVTLNQPPLGRSGNASLLLRFTWYEAVVLPDDRPTTPAGPPPRQNTTGNTTGTALFDAPPRTFITSRSVDGDR